MHFLKEIILTSNSILWAYLIFRSVFFFLLDEQFLVCDNFSMYKGIYQF